jgi:multidrug efflux system membrane fusion protein
MTTVQPRKKVEEPPPDGAPTKPQAQPEHRDGARPGESLTDKRLTPAPAKKSRWWVWLLLVLAAGGGGYYVVEHTTLLQSSKGGAAGKANQRSIPVVTAKVRKGDVPLYLSSLGTVTPLQTVVVKTRVDGEVMKVLYTEGQMVKVGDPLVEIDPRPYQVMQEQAEGQLAKDQASLVQSKQDLQRDQRLIAAKATTPQVLDAQVSTVGQFEGATKTDQAAIDNAKLQIVYCHITAPISGRIGLRQVDMGNLVQAAAATTLATITQLQPITVVFTVPQDEIFRVQQKFNSGEEVPVEAWNRDLATKLASGKLLAIDNQVDTTTGTVKLKATFPNEDNLLFPNEFVNAKLLIDVQRNVLIVPAGAVQRGPNGTYTYVVKENTEASDKDKPDPDAKDKQGQGDKEKKSKDIEMRMLKLGPTEGDQTIVESGLSVGEIVVTEGTDKLQPGVTKVSVRSGKSGRKGKAQGAKPQGDQSAPTDSKATPTSATDSAKTQTSGYRGGDSADQKQSDQDGSDDDQSNQTGKNGTKTGQ